ncbi:NifU family protein [Nitrospira defluvii]|nr:NifU family protein [Nitrospira defluvii]
MIEITDIAKKRIGVLIEKQREEHKKNIEGLKLTVKGAIPNIEYALAFQEAGKKASGDILLEVNGIKVYMEQKNAKFLEDIKIDFIQSLERTGFKIENPKVIESKTEKPESPPQLDTPEAIAVQKVLDTEINPAVASHGGLISLVDVKDKIAYIRLGGGCQGCGMADVTLKQGVVVAIKKGVPEIREVLDVTDHANGENPYYSPGK